MRVFRAHGNKATRLSGIDNLCDKMQQIFPFVIISIWGTRTITMCGDTLCDNPKRILRIPFFAHHVQRIRYGSFCLSRDIHLPGREWRRCLE
jgi:hypothetical protein